MMFITSTTTLFILCQRVFARLDIARDAESCADIEPIGAVSSGNALLVVNATRHRISRRDNRVTIWSKDNDNVIGSGASCGYVPNQDYDYVAALSPYIAHRMYCAGDWQLFPNQGGSGCGACYRLAFTAGEKNVAQSESNMRSGTADIQIVGSGELHNKPFDCSHSAFTQITSATTGWAVVDWHEIDCGVFPGGAIAAYTAGNRWWPEFMFNNLPRPVVSVKMVWGSKVIALNRKGAKKNDATWTLTADTCPGGGCTGAVSLEVMLSNGASVNFGNCFKTNGDTFPTPPVDCRATVQGGEPTSPFSPVDGGDGRVCRGADAGDNEEKYYKVISGVTSLDACKVRCLTEAACQGIEFHSGRGRCEVWTRSNGIESSKAVAGYTCLRFSGSSFRPFAGAVDRACRGASVRDNSPSYYTLSAGVSSLDLCMAKCTEIANCKGIEYKSSSGRCEVWTRASGIESSKQLSGYVCLEYGGSAAREQT